MAAVHDGAIEGERRSGASRGGRAPRPVDARRASDILADWPVPDEACAPPLPLKPLYSGTLVRREVRQERSCESAAGLKADRCPNRLRTQKAAESGGGVDLHGSERRSASQPAAWLNIGRINLWRLSQVVRSHTATSGVRDCRPRIPNHEAEQERFGACSDYACRGCSRKYRHSRGFPERRNATAGLTCQSSPRKNGSEAVGPRCGLGRGTALMSAFVYS